ncbi:Isochorismatase-like protein, partial [Mycena galopus ATCC 62051]
NVVHITLLGAPVFTPDTPLADIFPELAPLDRGIDASATDFEVLAPKRFPSSFAQTILDVIQRAGVRKVVLVGYMAHVCVSTTAREGHQRGYEAVVAEDAVGDRNVTRVGGRALEDLSRSQHDI